MGFLKGMADKGSIYIGTSGWSYPKGKGTWTGYFYPAGKINELEYYSQFFNTVEVNSSFYRPPNPAYVENWVRLTPRDFLFAVKIWQKFTHPRMYEAATGDAAVISQNDVDLFCRSLEPLCNSGKLGALLAQFPPSFRNDRHGQQILSAVLRTFGRYRLAVELRHRSWSDDPHTAEMLREHNTTFLPLMSKANEAVAAAVKQKDVIALVEANSQFHAHYAACSRNDYLIHALAQVRCETNRLAYLSFGNAIDPLRSLKEHYHSVVAQHEQIIESLWRQDEAKLKATLQEHSRIFQNRIIMYMAS